MDGAAGLRLVAVEQTPAAVKPGESVFLTLDWQTDAAIPDDRVAFAHLGTGLAGLLSHVALAARRFGAGSFRADPPGRRAGRRLSDRRRLVSLSFVGTPETEDR